LKAFTIDHTELNRLIGILKELGYNVLGPTVRDSAVVYEEISSINDLPIGWTDEQTNGTYRLTKQDSKSIFHWTVGPQSWKKFLFPPIQKIFATHKRKKEVDLPNLKKMSTQEELPRKNAFFGVRSCELSAIAIQDKVFLDGPYIDSIYQRKRSDVFIIAVQCSKANSTCFCVSMGCGPRAKTGFDLALTEIINENDHRFLVEVRTEMGEKILSSIRCTEASEEDLSTANEIIKNTEAHIGKSLDTQNLKNILYQNPEHPRWERTAARCLSCANCTMVCPTCFCSTVEDVTELTGLQADRIRKWDSCFTLDFSYIHGGSVRTSVKARYRQWLTHKLASWLDQFGTYGCVGCGRCITWCPVGIDITEEARAIRDNQM
jgi:ferredoxin